MRLTAQVSEVSPAAAQIVSFLAVPAATFDTEDHPSTGQKTSFLSSPGHAVSLFWRLRFGKPRWSEVEVCLKAKSRCAKRPEVSPPAQVSEVSPAAVQIVSFLAVPAATFDTEDHPSTGQKTSFLSSPGHAVSLFWRLRFGKPRWSEVEVCLKAKSRCEIRPEVSPPAQVSEVSPAAAQIVSFLAVPAATFDTEVRRPLPARGERALRRVFGTTRTTTTTSTITSTTRTRTKTRRRTRTRTTTRTTTTTTPAAAATTTTTRPKWGDVWYTERPVHVFPF